MAKKTKTGKAVAKQAAESSELYYEVENLTINVNEKYCNIHVNSGSPNQPPNCPPGGCK